MADDFVGVPYDRWLDLHQRVSTAGWFAWAAFVISVILAYLLFSKGILTVADLRAAGG